MITYKHAILAHKLYKQSSSKSDWINFNFNQTLTTGHTKFQTIKKNAYKVGNNLLSSSSSVVNNKIDLIDFT